MEEKPVEKTTQRKREENGPGRWSNKVEFFMASISSTIGLGNLWRFPYIAYRNGGGAFLIPFLIMIVFVGFPLVTLDLTLGQYSRKGPVGVWNLCPLFTGIGWSMLVMNFLCTTYYVMLMAYAVYYVAASFTAVLPWSNCDNYWNSAHCLAGKLSEEEKCHRIGSVWINSTCIYHETSDYEMLDSAIKVSPSEEYFHNQVLALAPDLDDIGQVRWALALCLLLAWILVIIALSMGTRSWGKLSYITALLPYIVMLALLIQASLKPGAGHGILYFISPHWSYLKDGKVWADALIQTFFSVGCAWGSFITLGKHNKFHNNPIIDAGLLVLGDFFTSIFCGLVIFAVLGGMAHSTGVDVSEVTSAGVGLAFIVYPKAVLALPCPQLWSVLFFLMLINLGLGSAIPQLANILGSLTDEFSVLRTKRNRMLTLLGLSFISFLIGLVYTTNGGIYVLTLMDYYVAPICLLIIGLLETIVVAWIYGSGKLLLNLSQMTGWRPNYFFFFTIFWRVICPVAIIGVIVSTSMNWFTPSYGDYVFPAWANFVGWFVTFCELLVIPMWIITKLCLAQDRHEIRNMLRPTVEWDSEAKRNQDASVIYPTTEALITSKV